MDRDAYFRSAATESYRFASRIGRSFCYCHIGMMFEIAAYMLLCQHIRTETVSKGEDDDLSRRISGGAHGV
jgi:hypothetical protein